MIAADGQHSTMGDRAFLNHENVGRSSADVSQADAEFAFVRTKHRIGAGQRFEDRVVHVYSGAIHGGDNVLSGRVAAVIMWTRTSSRVAIMPSGS